MDMRVKKSVVLLISVLFFGCLALAQAPGRGVGGRERLRENINRLRLLRMTEVLGLTEEQTAKIYPVYYRMEREKMEIIKRLNAEIAGLKALLGEPAPKDEDIAPRIRAVNELRRDLLAKDQQFDDFMSQNLSLDQEARYLIFSVEFFRALGEKLDRARAAARARRQT
jgi:hypothetical protein